MRERLTGYSKVYQYQKSDTDDSTLLDRPAAIEGGGLEPPNAMSQESIAGVEFNFTSA